MTDAAGIDSYAHFFGTRGRYVAFDDLEIAARFWNLYGSHLVVCCVAHVRRFRATTVYGLVMRKRRIERYDCTFAAGLSPYFYDNVPGFLAFFDVPVCVNDVFE